LTIIFLGTFVGALFLSFVLTKLVRDVATQKGWVAAPAQPRHLHNRALPRLGGVAIVFSFLIATGTALVATRLMRPELSPSLRPLLTILPPAILIFLLGVYDDIRSVGPYWKFLVQAIAGAMLFAGGLRILDLPVLFGAHQFSWITGLPVTILWVMAITNAFNLIDGLDGLAAGSALFSTLVVFVVALLGNLSLLFIGFMLSALALYGAQKAPTIIAVAIPMVSFGLPILETSLSVLRRFISGRPVFTADREHIHHKLLQRGMSHRQVVIVLYGVSAVFALLSLFLLWPTGSTLGLVLAVLGTGVWIGVQHLGYLEFGEIRRVAQRTIEQRQIVVNNLAIRRATEELKVAESFQQVGRILTAAFDSNDFDAFELRAEVAGRGFHLVDAEDIPQLRWSKPGSFATIRFGDAWSMTLRKRALREPDHLQALCQSRFTARYQPVHFSVCNNPGRSSSPYRNAKPRIHAHNRKSITAAGAGRIVLHNRTRRDTFSAALKTLP